MTKKALMAIFEVGHILEMPNGYKVQKGNDNVWYILHPRNYHLAMIITGTVPTGEGGSLDGCIQQLVDGLCKH